MRSLLDGFFTAQDFSYDPDDKRFPMSLTCDHPERPNEKMHFVPTEYAAEVAADVANEILRRHFSDAKNAKRVFSTNSKSVIWGWGQLRLWSGEVDDDIDTHEGLFS